MAARTKSSVVATGLEVAGQSVGWLAGGIALLLLWSFSLTSDLRGAVTPLDRRP